MLVHDFLLESGNRWPDAEALVAGGRFTYADLLNASSSLAASLAESGVKPGDRIAVLTDVPFDYIVSYFGTLLAGGVFVGLNTQTSERTVLKLLSDSGSSAVLTNRKFLKFFNTSRITIDSLNLLASPGGGVVSGIACRDLNEMLHAKTDSSFVPPIIESSALAQIIYTSGTTGTPKGVMLSHQNLVANTLSTVKYLGLTENDSVMVVLPFFYSYGNSVLLTHIAAGGKLVVNQSLMYPNLILDQIIKERVTGFSGVPSTFSLLLNKSAIHDNSFPHLRYLTQAGGAMSIQLADRLSGALPDVPIFVMYGQTEAAPRLSYLEPEELRRKPGSIGKAIPGVTLEVLDQSGGPVQPGEIGELTARGENVMLGYWGQPEATAEVLRDGRLWTGDLATIDAEGYLYLHGRKSEMIKSGAHRIAPREIEDVLLEHEAVLESAVIGVDDDILGESIVACVVLKQSDACSEKDLINHCHRILPAFKVPHRIKFCIELPKTESGKVKKTELKSYN
ncbi:long-chain-fatty-acid--CoA ligase [Geobacter sp. OR-1]|nr:long-chain-fatty-acid--CoA ligase [Geobacter sp. OR-1]